MISPPLEKIHIGTSGWNYDHWVGPFYPQNLQSEALLPHYAETFSAVELNNSFYQLPKPETVEEWAQATPEDFIFTVKASRYLTHMKKLREPQEGIERLLEAIEPFGEKLGPILFQLPPNWKANPERLRNFLEALPDDFDCAFEFRDRSWLCDEIYDVLRDHNAANCFYDFKGYQSPEISTADFIYVRLHGPNTTPYTGSYDGRTLAGYARKFLRWQNEGKEVFCFFDNDEKSYAPADTRNMLKSIGRQS